MINDSDPKTLLTVARQHLASLYTGTPENALSDLLRLVGDIPGATMGGHYVVRECDVVVSMVPRVEYAISRPVGTVARNNVLDELGGRFDRIERVMTGPYV